MKNYGKELILDLHNCNSTLFTRKHIRKYFKELCLLIDMEREAIHWWDYKGHPEEYALAPPHLKGTTAVQFIKTSNITIHALDDLRKIYLNIFSCRDFDENVVIKFTESWFEGRLANQSIVSRI